MGLFKAVEWHKNRNLLAFKEEAAYKFSWLIKSSPLTRERVIAMKKTKSLLFSGSPFKLALATLLVSWTGFPSTSFAATRIPDLNEIAYQEMLREQGVESQKALAQGEDCSPRSEMSHKVGIIGQDRRRRLSAQEEQDYSGVLAVYSEEADFGGSGFLVCDGSVVLTNAHNFYNGETGQLRASLPSFKAFLSNKAGDFQEVEFDTRPGSYVVGGTRNHRELRDQDWILIRLKNRPNPRDFKPLKVRAQPETLQVRNQPNSGIKVVGFLNKDNWDKYSSSCANFRSASSVWQFSSSIARVYAHDCSTEAGASGSPIIQGTCQGAPQVIAVHAGGNREFRSSFNNDIPGIGNNTAAPINQAILDGMRQLCGDSFQNAVCPPQDQMARH